MADRRRPSPWHKALFRSRSAVERTNSRIKVPFNLKYHKNRGWNPVEHCALFAAIAMLGVAWVAVETGHPDKIRSACRWISLNSSSEVASPLPHFTWRVTLSAEPRGACLGTARLSSPAQPECSRRTTGSSDRPMPGHHDAELLSC